MGCAGKQENARAGFTLLEVLVAIAVLSVLLITLYQAYGSNIYIQSFNRSLWKAILHAHNELAAYERGAVPPISFHEGDYEKNHPMEGFHWEREISDVRPMPGVRLRQVRLALSWSEGEAKRNYEAKVYVLPK